MRTTIRIDHELYRQVKAMAVRSGRTVAAVLEDAVGELRSGVDLSSNAAAAEALEEGASIDALR